MADYTTYKQGMKSLGYAPEEEDMNQTEEHEFYSGLIITEKVLFLHQESHFRMDCPFLGGNEESESPETQTSTGRSAKY